MANNKVTQGLKDIADAIRERSGEDGLMTAAEMPEKIKAIPAGEEPSGVLEITENGEYDVASKAGVDVNVPVPPGYVLPAGTKSITANGEVDVAAFAAASINVPQGVFPEGSLDITENADNIDVANKASVNVNVQSAAGKLSDGYWYYKDEEGEADGFHGDNFLSYGAYELDGADYLQLNSTYVESGKLYKASSSGYYYNDSDSSGLSEAEFAEADSGLYVVNYPVQYSGALDKLEFDSFAIIDASGSIHCRASAQELPNEIGDSIDFIDNDYHQHYRLTKIDW